MINFVSSNHGELENKKPTTGRDLSLSYQFPDTAEHATPRWVLYSCSDFMPCH